MKNTHLLNIDMERLSLEEAAEKFDASADKIRSVSLLYKKEVKK